MVIGLGVILLIGAVVTVLRPDKIKKPPGSAGPTEPGDRDDGSRDPFKAAAPSGNSRPGGRATTRSKTLQDGD
jgi:hypothetical protein